MAEINTIIGTNGPDSLEGTSGNDSIDALAGADTIVAKQGGNDSINAGADNDVIGMGHTLTAADTIDGGDGKDDFLYFTDSNNASNDLDNVTRVEHIILGDAATDITAKFSLGTIDSAVDVDGSNLTHSMTFDGSHVVVSSLGITGGTGNDVITGGQWGDVIIGKMGGNDTINGGVGDDVIGMGTQMNSADHIDGGTGNDTLWLQDEDVATNTLDNVRNVENINFDDAQTKVTTVDDLVASGKTLNVDASRILTSTLTWDGAAETNGHFNIVGGANGDSIVSGTQGDTIFAGAGDDSITSSGGNDWLKGQDGNDTIAMGTTLNNADTINGGAGNDTLTYKASSSTVTSDLAHVQNIETIILGDAATNVKTVDTNVYAGKTLTVDGSALTAGHRLTWNGAAESDGNFVITGGADKDTITAGHGTDYISTGAGSNVVDFGAYLNSSDTVAGGDECDVLRYIDDGSGVDELKNVTKMDVIQLMGNSPDVVVWDDNAAAGLIFSFDGRMAHGTVRVDGSAETDAKLDIDGNRFDDTLIGGAGDDVFDSYHGKDTLIGKFGGNDYFFSGPDDDTIGMGHAFTDADTIYGGTGNDTLWFTSDGSTYNMSNVEGIETINLGDADTYITVADGHTVTDSTTTALLVNGANISELDTLNFRFADAAENENFRVSVVGGAGNDDLQGAKLNDTLVGGAGNDNLVGNDGNDSLLGGLGNDTIVTGAGNDTVYAGSGDDDISATNGIDNIHAGDGNDTIRLTAQSGGTVDGGAGTDTIHMQGNMANITSISNVEIINVLGDATIASDVLSGQTLSFTGAANLTMTDSASTKAVTVDASHFSTTGTNKFSITGSKYDDTLSGSQADDTINGGTGADTISGGAGNDTIDGGAGIDTLNLDDGDDVHVISDGSTLAGQRDMRDVVDNFTVGHDKIKYTGGTDHITTLTGSAQFGHADSMKVVTEQGALTVAAETKVVQVTAADAATLGTDGTELLAAIGVANVTTTANAVVLFLVDNGTDTGLYLGASDTGGGSDTTLSANEISLIDVYHGVTADQFTADAGDFMSPALP